MSLYIASREMAYRCPETMLSDRFRTSRTIPIYDYLRKRVMIYLITTQNATDNASLTLLLSWRADAAQAPNTLDPIHFFQLDHVLVSISFTNHCSNDRYMPCVPTRAVTKLPAHYSKPLHNRTISAKQICNIPTPPIQQ